MRFDKRFDRSKAKEQIRESNAEAIGALSVLVLVLIIGAFLFAGLKSSHDVFGQPSGYGLTLTNGIGAAQIR
jgi:hypothetical protein